jgi:hypothetical protein
MGRLDPITPYLLLGSIMEFAVVCFFPAIGFLIPVQRGKKSESAHGLGGCSSVEEL